MDSALKCQMEGQVRSIQRHWVALDKAVEIIEKKQGK